MYTPVLKQWAVRDLSGDYLTAKSGTAQPEVLYATLANAIHMAFPDLAVDNIKSAMRKKKRKYAAELRLHALSRLGDVEYRTTPALPMQGTVPEHLHGALPRSKPAVHTAELLLRK